MAHQEEGLLPPPAPVLCYRVRLLPLPTGERSHPARTFCEDQPAGLTLKKHADIKLFEEGLKSNFHKVEEATALMQTQMECDSDLCTSETECSLPGLDTEYLPSQTPAPSSDEEDLKTTSQSEQWTSEEAIHGSDTNSSNDDDQQRDKSPVPTSESVQQRKRKHGEEGGEDGGSDPSSSKKRHEPCSEDGNSHSDDIGSELSSPEKRCEPCSEERNSDLDDQSPETCLANKTSQKKKKKKEKRGKQTKTVEATDGGSELSSELDVVAVDQSPGTTQTPLQKKKKKKKRGSQKKTVKEGMLEKPVLKVKKPWSDTERSAVHKHLANFIAERRVPGKEACTQCLKKESTLDGRSWKDIKNFVHNTIVTLNRSVLPEVSSGWQLWRCVKSGLLPFLRAAALFFHYLNSAAPPADLLGSGPGQWEALCSYLSLPSNLLLLYHNNHTLLEPLVHRWCCHPDVRQTLQEGGVIIRFPRESNRLIDLPEDYSVLINQASSFTCPRSGGDKSRAPTLCLVCGSMLCSQSYCCQTEVDGEDVGACTAHTFTCGAGLGLFLRVRESQVLFVAGKTKGCFYPPPYLDDYGETDQGLKRGNPLHLCSERYRKIERLWQQHSVAEVIGHAQEANQTLVAIDWQHL